MSIGRDGVGLEPHPGAPVGGTPAPPTAAAVLAWARARDAALRGLVHALSNRVGTVGAVGAMLDGAGPDTVATAARVLAGEGERLEALLALFRLATADAEDAEAEPLHVGELLAQAAALAGYAVPETVIRLEVGRDVPPAVAPYATLVQALLAGAVDAARAGAGEVVLWAEAAGDAVALGARTPGGGVFTLRLPTLGSTRPGTRPGPA